MAQNSDDDKPSETTSTGVKILIWLAVVLINISVWGIIGLLSGAWPIGFTLSLIYLVVLFKLLTREQRKYGLLAASGVPSGQIRYFLIVVQRLWVLVPIFVAILGAYLAHNIVEPMVTRDVPTTTVYYDMAPPIPANANNNATNGSGLTTTLAPSTAQNGVPGAVSGNATALTGSSTVESNSPYDDTRGSYQQDDPAASDWNEKVRLAVYLVMVAVPQFASALVLWKTY